jgi:hypothetical protein
MSATDALSQELFFQAHRGISQYKPTPLKKNLGMHWTTEENIANELADRVRSSRPDGPEYRTIVHANIPVSSQETDTGVLEERRVFNSSNLNKNIEK